MGILTDYHVEHRVESLKQLSRQGRLEKDGKRTVLEKQKVYKVVRYVDST